MSHFGFFGHITLFLLCCMSHRQMYEVVFPQPHSPDLPLGYCRSSFLHHLQTIPPNPPIQSNPSGLLSLDSPPKTRFAIDFLWWFMGGSRILRSFLVMKSSDLPSNVAELETLLRRLTALHRALETGQMPGDQQKQRNKKAQMFCWKC